MENIVIFKDPIDTSGHGCLMPSPQYDLEWICKRDVPQGQPYCVISSSMLPTNYFKERGFYDFDFTNPTGWGSGSSEPYGGNLPSIFTISHTEWLDMKKNNLI
jgi:hypothetical protein